MRTILLLLFLIFGIESSLAETTNVIDSIRVTGYKYNFETVHSIGRYEFLETLVDKLLSPFKQMLGLFNIHMVDTKGGMIPSRMVYW